MTRGNEAPRTISVSELSITVGLAYPDISAFAILNDKFDIGDPEQQAAAVLDGWWRDGLLPVDGTDIELVFRKYSILSSNDKLGVHAGTQQFRTVEWSADCPCWTARTEMVDFSG